MLPGLRPGLLQGLLRPLSPLDHRGSRPGHAAPLLSSIVHELDLVFVLNSTIVIWCTAILVWRCLVRAGLAAPPAGAGRGGRLLPAGAAALFVLGIPSVFSSAYRNVQHHPLLVLAHESTRRSLIEELRHEGGMPPEVRRARSRRARPGARLAAGGRLAGVPRRVTATQRAADRPGVGRVAATARRRRPSLAPGHTASRPTGAGRRGVRFGLQRLSRPRSARTWR